MKFAQDVSFSAKSQKTGIKLLTFKPGCHGNGSCDFGHFCAIWT